jgi:hypothetical protein
MAAPLVSDLHMGSDHGFDRFGVGAAIPRMEGRTALGCDEGDAGAGGGVH